MRGAGLRQAMATFGALVGATTAAVAYNLSGRNYILTFAIASIPAVAALVIIYTAFAEDAKASKPIVKKSGSAAVSKIRHQRIRLCGMFC